MTTRSQRSTQVRIGAGAGFSGDRIEPAVELVERGDLDYLVFECLAERTIALAQQARLADPAAGYDPMLDERMRAVLPASRERGVRIVSNMGAANPVGAALHICRLACELEIFDLSVAAVTGDDVLDLVLEGDFPLIGQPGTVASLGKDRIISANAYLGARPIVEALGRKADVVVTGRVTDPALFLAPLIYEFGWSYTDWARLGRGTLVGHLLECAGQISGGYFADPGVKDVPGLARLGFPFAAVDEDGRAMIGKVEGSGGRIDAMSCKEQLLYELTDPGEYLTADVTADFTDVAFAETGADRVAVAGGGGRVRPETLKVSVGYHDGYVGEGQISYAGPGAVERARLAGAVVRERLALTGIDVSELRCELIGVDAVRRGAGGTAAPPAEARLRVAGRTVSQAAARRIGAEVEALYTNGPAGGGGVRRAVEPVVAIASTLVPRDQVAWNVEIFRS